MTENFVKKVYSGNIGLRTEFEKASFAALSDLSMKYAILETQLSDSINGEFLNIILSSSTDFDDFKIKYNKYLKIKNNNSKVENFIKKDLNINFDLIINNRVITKKNINNRFDLKINNRVITKKNKKFNNSSNL